MDALRHPRRHGYRWRQLFSYVVLLISFMVIQLMWSQAHGDMISFISKCSNYTTCKSCTNNTDNCSWLLHKQQCEFLTVGKSSLPPSVVQKGTAYIINLPQFCPTYAVNNIRDMNTFGYKMSIHLDGSLNGYKSFLVKNDIECVVNFAGRHVKFVPSTGAINCNVYRVDSDLLYRSKAVVNIVTVRVDGHPVMLEKDRDYYVILYDHDCGRIAEDDGCATCAWHDAEYKYFNRWCAKNSTCTGLWHTSYMHSTSKNRLEAFSDLELTCPEIRVRLIGPKYGVLGGKTTVTFSVSNHWILAENQTVAVTVAGWDCAARRDDGDAISCTVKDAATDGIAHEGPVRVTYTTWRSQTYAVTSEQPFRFVRPEPTGVSADCVPLKGGHLLTIAGRHMDAGNAVVVTVAGHVRCETLSRDSERIVCVTGAADEPVVGRVHLEFDRSPSVLVGAPVSVYPDAAVLDADQSFASIAAGGTAIPVRGRHFACAARVELAVDGAGRTACDVTNDTYVMCRSPPVTVAGHAAVAADATVEVWFRGGDPGSAPAKTPLALVAYPDPVFDGFDVRDGTVVIRARDPNRSGYAADDLSVLFPDSAGRGCIVVEAAADGVRCVPDPPLTAAADLVEIVVAVGDTLRRNVTRRAETVRGDDGSLVTFTTWTLVAVPVVFFLSLIVVLRPFLGSKQQYNVKTPTDPSELQPVDQFKPATVASQ